MLEHNKEVQEVEADQVVTHGMCRDNVQAYRVVIRKAEAHL